MNELVRLARSLVREVIVAPIRRGHPRPSRWPRGLGAIVTVSFVLTGALLAATLLAPLLRKALPLQAPPAMDLMPVGSLQILLGAGLLVAILIQVAGLHGSWAVRIGTLAITAMTLSAFVALAEKHFWWAPVVAFAILVLLVIARRKRSFHWIEFPLVAVPLLLGSLLPLTEINTFLGTSLDQSGIAFLSALLVLSVAATPALVSAGFAPSDVAIRAGDWMADRFTDSLRSSLPWILGALALGLAVEAVLAFQSGLPDLPTPTELGAVIAHASVAVALAIPMWVFGRRAGLKEYPDLQHLRERWEPATLLFGLGMALFYAISTLSNSLASWGLVLEVEFLSVLADVLLMRPGGMLLSEIWISLLALTAYVVGLRRARRGRPLLGVAASAMLGPSLVSLGAISVQSGAKVYLSDDAIGVLAAGVGIAILLWDAITPERTPVNVAALLLVALPVAYHFRFVLAEPFTALVGTGGAAIVVIGLLWDLLSGWDVTEKRVAGLPEPSRVLVMAASLLAATTATAYAGLSRSSGSALDTSVLPGIGDGVMGRPLYLAAVILLAYAALHPKGSLGRVAAGTRHPSTL